MFCVFVRVSHHRAIEMRINGPRVPDRRFSTTAGGDPPSGPTVNPSNPAPSRGISELLLRLLDTEVVEVLLVLLVVLLLLLLHSGTTDGCCSRLADVISLLLRRRTDNELLDSLDLCFKEISFCF